MERPSIATEKEVQQELLKIDLENIINRLERYAYSLTSNSSLYIEPFDLVAEVLDKVQSCKRRWDKNKCPSFIRFLFSAVRSHCNNSVKINSNQKKLEEEYSYSYFVNRREKSAGSNIDYDTIRKIALEELSKLKPTIEEESVFDCWLEGITKPQEISKLLELTDAEIANAVKRLNRKVAKIKKKIKPYFDEK